MACPAVGSCIAVDEVDSSSEVGPLTLSQGQTALARVKGTDNPLGESPRDR
jgi:hypothetical protein